MLDGIPAAVVAVEPGTGRVLAANRSARELSGDDPVGGSAAAWLPAERCRDADGRPLAEEHLPAVRAARGERLRGGQLLLGKRAAVGVATAVSREPGGGGAADGIVAAQLARGAVGGEHAAGAGLDGHDRSRDPVQHRIRPADLGSARRGR